MPRLLTVAVLLLFAAIAGCGQSPPGTKTDPEAPEKTHLVIGSMPIPDAAPLQIALRSGFFAAEGLTVEIETVQGGGYAIPKLVGGSMDVAILNYITAIKAHSEDMKLALLADSYQAAPGTFVLMVAKDSPVQSPADLRGKTIAVATLRSIGTLTVEVALKVHGLSAGDVKLVEIPLPNMPAALKAGTVDALWMTEPFITAAGTNLGARKIYDVMSGPTADFPIAGWGTTATFAAKHPKTIAAFQRAMAKAQHLAASNREAVTAILPTYTKIDEETAKVITLGRFPTTLERRRLQRVADTMKEYDYLDEPVDVSEMLVPAATSTGGTP
ncbi:ABC transporter substrate-binding protein [Planomonospora sp. ID91781]|uniref:ABC transporter substrate-binding protein n=1 Tax=Planomonospora sp. ID91781 TaxID=2738135 RepID=UPI0018C41061|nr:ABC transporter substrate-binding protein [Planomonospora sp. ID91781]MBG0825689.1 ABC transporter substrate-binding protein [Planomonospora sp. ID91781]